MTLLHIGDTDCHTYGHVPAVGVRVPCFNLAAVDLSVVRLADFNNQPVIISVIPSIETETCFQSVRKLNEIAKEHPNWVVLCVSMDLPYTLRRVAQYEQLEHVRFLSDFRNRAFGSAYGLTIADGCLAGLLARCILVLNKEHRVVYQDLVDDICHLPDMAKMLSALNEQVA